MKLCIKYIGSCGLTLGILLGCGTVGGSRTITSVDSPVRGEPVYDRDGQFLGKTPLFVDLLPEPRLILRTGQGLQHRRHRIDCDFGWWQTPLENSPLMLISGPALSTFGVGFALASGVFVGSLVDTVSGAGFQCPSYIALKTRGNASSLKPEIRCGLEMPPQLSVEHRDHLAQLWKKSVHGSRLCADYIPTDRLYKQQRITRLPTEFRELDETEKLKVYRFGFETGVDKLVRLDVDKVLDQVNMPKDAVDPSTASTDTDGVEMGTLIVKSSAIGESNTPTRDSTASPQMVDEPVGKTDTGRIENQPEQSQSWLPIALRAEVTDLHLVQTADPIVIEAMVPPEVALAVRKETVVDYARQYISFVPDAFALAAGNNRVQGNLANGIPVDAYSPIGSLVITSVSHPSGYRRWDYHPFLSPEIVADVFENEFKVDRSYLGTESDQVAFRFRRWGGGVAGYFDMHTPLGAVGVGAAAGGVLIVASEPDAVDLSPVVGLRLRYTVFLTKKIFSQIAVETDQMWIELDEAEMNGASSVKLQLGVHLPEVEGWMRSVF